MDYLTEEELYELEHQDELDALNEIESHPFETDNFDLFHSTRSFSKVKEQEIPKSRITEAQKSQSVILDDSSETLENSTLSEVPTLNSCDNEDKENHCSSLTVSKKSTTEREGNACVKRKLLFSSQENQEDNEDPSCVLNKQGEKRKANNLSDDEIEDDCASKRTCPNTEETVSELSATKSSSNIYSRPLFSESSSLSQETCVLTRSDGKRVYVCVKDEEDDSHLAPSISQKISSLLPTSITELKSQYFLQEEQILKDQEAALELILRASTSALSETETMDIDDFVEETLWVEKYRPVSYMDLLSEEGINRTLLQWLKLWDKIVFGKERKTKKKVVEEKKPNKFQKWGELINELDEHSRPYHKVAFLCGSPGLGKTTLATIIAKHAGYNVVEINASDDRSPEAFRTSLEASTQMKSVLHEDRRPNCLILDEIDGAPAASINVLLAFIKSPGIPKGTKRKKGDIPLLTRPIICICNDQYSPALKPLRQLGLVLNFPSTATSRLASRLNQVSSKEGLVTDMAALTFLCEKAANDIRSCLSTLQFIYRMKKELKVSDLKRMQIGQKDMQKSLFAVWQDVFYFKEKKSFTDIHNIIQAFGDYDKIYVGIFENYLNLKFKHRNVDFVWTAADWLCFGDIVQQQIALKQQYLLLPYLPYPAVAFHVMFATNTFPHISYPAAFFEHKTKGSQLSSTLTSMIKDMISSLKTFLNAGILLTDVFPFLVEIIKPNLRPVNTQLYSEREKNELRRVIELMLAFNLNYRQERALDGTYNYVLEPNVEELIKFSNIKTKKTLGYSAKQMIAREVEMEQMRKGDSSADEKAQKIVNKPLVKAPEPKIFQKKEVKSDKPVLDFFGRQVVQPPKTDEEKKKDENREDVWFHFKEGYSNAVRRTVFIKDLL